MKSEKFAILVAKNPNNELFRFSLAQALSDEGKPADAIPHFDQCLAQKPDWMMAAILKGKCLLSLGQTAEAKPVLEQALQLAIVQHHEAPEAEVRKLLSGL